MSLFTRLVSFLYLAATFVACAPLLDNIADSQDGLFPGRSCFPALDFKMPVFLPENNTHGWWCDPSTEYAFVGFSYEVTACKYPDR